MNFSEEFLHFIWQFRLYKQFDLNTTEGESITVLNLGFLNNHAGPDFSNAKINIAGTIWVGHVEIHIKASDWLLHKHQFDPAYDNVILHVVYENDVVIKRSDGTLLPTLVLKNKFELTIWDNFQGLVNTVSHFPCENQISAIDPFIISNFLSRVQVERLVQKSLSIYQKLAVMNNNWDEAFYHFMARNFGFKVNALPMELLAQSLPQNILAKHKNNQLQIEALLFGQAGFLNQKFADTYPNLLKREYLFLKKKYKLKAIDLSLWKFLRMRPQNFPTLRLAQFAALIFKSSHLFSKIINLKDYKNAAVLFENLPVNPFWEKHYHFSKTADIVNVQLGKASIENILINTLSVFLFAYGKRMDLPNFEMRAIHILEQIPKENNVIVKHYELAGVVLRNAFQSQAILQLNKYYCNEKKCLNCAIGIKLLKQ